MKKMHKEMKESKKNITETIEAIRLRRTAEFEELETQCFTLEGAALTSKLQIDELTTKVPPYINARRLMLSTSRTPPDGLGWRACGLCWTMVGHCSLRNATT